MPVAVKFGRKAAVADEAFPFLHSLEGAKTLPPPPPTVNWYAGIGSWGMLGNDTAGNCVEAAAGHSTLQWTTYADTPAQPTTAEAIALYSAITGYVPGDEATDNGTEVMGSNGLMQYWVKNGIIFGGKKSYAKGIIQIQPDNLEKLQQGAHYFGGFLLGLDVPEDIVAGDTIPYLWSDPSGPTAGGHEVWVDGYLTENKTLYFDFITWGQRCRMTQGFLIATAREAQSLYDPDSLNARGMNADDFDATQLLADMQELRRQAA